MLQTGVVFIVIGTLVAFGGFIFALLKMLNQVKKFGSRRFSPIGLMTDHIGAMIFMASGSFLAFIGYALVVISLVQKFM